MTVPVGDTAGFVAGLETVPDGGVGDPRAQIAGQFDWAETVERTTRVLEAL